MKINQLAREGIRTHTVAVALIVAVLSGGCAERKQVSVLEEKFADLARQLTELKSEVETLRREKSFDELLRNLDSIAYLTPGSDGYSVIQSDLGRMTVSLSNIEPYANGSRVTLQFGNPTSANLNSAKAKLEWGSVDEKGSPRNESARSREITFSQSLRAGAWTNVPVVLEGVQPKELGFVRVREFVHRSISLLK